MTADQLIALLPIMLVATTAVVVMLLAAFLPNHRVMNMATLVGLALAFASLFLLIPVAPMQVTPLIIIDGFALFYSGLMLLAGIAVTALSYRYFNGGNASSGGDGVTDLRQGEYYILLLVAVLGALVLVSCNHFASFFIGLELLGVSLYVMVAYLAYIQDGREASLEAGIKYLILSGVASALLLFGIALLYAEFGTLEFGGLARAWVNPLAVSNPVVIAGVGLMMAGIGFKLSLVPFHLWTPDVYEGAPAPVTAFVATVSKGAIFAVTLRLFISTGALGNEAVVHGLSLVAVISMIVGNLLALLQDNVKRILAYSSIAHIGYLLVPLLAGATGLVHPAQVGEAVAFYLTAYFVTTLGAFGVVSALSTMRNQRDKDHIDDYRGLFWRNPALAVVFAAMLLSLAGIPLTAGFIGKFYLFTVGAEGLMWALLGTLIVGSAIGLYYYLRLIITLFVRDEPEKAERRKPFSLSTADGLVLGVTAGLLLGLGVFPEPLIGLIRLVQ